jgi:hypothetical protein
MTDARAVGRKVLAGLAAGRADAAEFWREQAEHNERVVREALDVDILAGHKARGRKARIARAVRGRVRVYVSEGDVRDYISSKGVGKILERLSGRSDSTWSDPVKPITGERE